MRNIEDLAGKVVMVLIFSLSAYGQISAATGLLAEPGKADHFALELAGRVATAIFLCLIVTMTVLRHDPKKTAEGLEPRLTSIAGTYCLLLLVVVPRGEAPESIVIVSNILLVVGTILSIWCMFNLGRSFSIMATARRLVVDGPYAYVRHPLYSAEAITVLGAILAAWSPWALLLGGGWWLLQYRRMINEERVLAEAFPEYLEYAAHVPRIMPRMVPYRPDRATAD